MTEPASDEMLMAAYQAGDRAAFTELYERHCGSVYGFLARRVPNRALADDLFQEVFLRVHRARHTFDRERPFRAWLFGIVHHLLIDALRDQQRTPRALDLDDAEAAAIGGVGSELAPACATPEEAASARESARALGHAVRALPADEATVLMLARIEGLSYEEIALVIGRSAAATKQLAYRALKRVRADVAAGHGERS